MSRLYELDPVSAITASAVGEVGQRTFYLQARKDDEVVSLLVEKEQVAVLCQQVEQFLARLPERELGEEVDPAGLELREPVVPEFRVGPMALGYDGDRDLVLLQCEELLIEEEDEDEEEEEIETGAEGATSRFWATREQMHALARHGMAVVAAGRPLCPMCGEPKEDDGHLCPQSNGHRKLTSWPETREL